jgi:hypothetical protein
MPKKSRKGAYLGKRIKKTRKIKGGMLKALKKRFTSTPQTKLDAKLNTELHRDKVILEELIKAALDETEGNAQVAEAAYNKFLKDCKKTYSHTFPPLKIEQYAIMIAELASFNASDPNDPAAPAAAKAAATAAATAAADAAKAAAKTAAAAAAAAADAKAAAATAAAATAKADNPDAVAAANAAAQNYIGKKTPKADAKAAFDAYMDKIKLIDKPYDEQIGLASKYVRDVFYKEEPEPNWTEIIALVVEAYKKEHPIIEETKDAAEAEAAAVKAAGAKAAAAKFTATAAKFTATAAKAAEKAVAGGHGAEAGAKQVAKATAQIYIDEKNPKAAAEAAFAAYIVAIKPSHSSKPEQIKLASDFTIEIAKEANQNEPKLNNEEIKVLVDKIVEAYKKKNPTIGNRAASFGSAFASMGSVFKSSKPATSAKTVNPTTEDKKTPIVKTPTGPVKGQDKRVNANEDADGEPHTIFIDIYEEELVRALSLNSVDNKFNLARLVSRAKAHIQNLKIDSTFELAGLIMEEFDDSTSVAVKEIKDKAEAFKNKLGEIIGRHNEIQRSAVGAAAVGGDTEQLVKAQLKLFEDLNETLQEIYAAYDDISVEPFDPINLEPKNCGQMLPVFNAVSTKATISTIKGLVEENVTFKTPPNGIEPLVKIEYFNCLAFFRFSPTKIKEVLVKHVKLLMTVKKFEGSFNAFAVYMGDEAEIGSEIGSEFGSEGRGEGRGDNFQFQNFNPARGNPARGNPNRRFFKGPAVNNVL